MQYEESIGRVWQRSGMFYSDDAKTDSSATLAVLGECLNGRERFAGLLSHQAPRRGVSFSPNSLVHLGHGETLSYAVMGVLREVVGRGEMEGVRRRSPGGFDPLFESRTGLRALEPSSGHS